MSLCSYPQILAFVRSLLSARHFFCEHERILPELLRKVGLLLGMHLYAIEVNGRLDATTRAAPSLHPPFVAFSHSRKAAISILTTRMRARYRIRSTKTKVHVKQAIIRLCPLLFLSTCVIC